MSELKVTTLKHASSAVDSIVMASSGAVAFGAAVTDSAGVAIKGGVPAQAWVNFNGTGTVAIRASYNVSSITDNGVGDYTVNFTTAMANANYAVVGMAVNGTATNLPANRIFGIYADVGSVGGSAPTTSAFRIATIFSTDTLQDCARITATVFV